MDHDDRISKIEKLMDDVIEKNPHSKNIVNAFRPVMMERIRVVEGLALKNADTLKVDRRKFKAGVPVARQVVLFHPDDPWEDIAISMIPAIRQGFPGLMDDLEKLEASIKKGQVVLYDYFKSYPDNGENIINRWSSELNIGVPAIFFLIKSTTRIVLEKKAEKMDWKGIDWTKGYCPICGSFPSIAMIKEKIAERWLHCSHCGYEWKFSRVICPYCEHEGYKEMPFFFVQDNDKECAYACDKCKRYLITLTRVSDLNIRDLDISAVSLTHLDIIMQDKGFQPMAVCEWNVF
jgi:FdhE protein